MPKASPRFGTRFILAILRFLGSKSKPVQEQGCHPLDKAHEKHKGGNRSKKEQVYSQHARLTGMKQARGRPAYAGDAGDENSTHFVSVCAFAHPPAQLTAKKSAHRAIYPGSKAKNPLGWMIPYQVTIEPTMVALLVFSPKLRA